MPEAECSTFGRSDAAAGSRGKSVTVLRDRNDLPTLSFLAERREGFGIDWDQAQGSIGQLVGGNADWLATDFVAEQNPEVG